MKSCIAATASVNISIKAQNALASGGVRSRIISLPPGATRRGCAYGVEFDCADEQRARSILRRAGVRVSQFIKGGEGVSV